MTKKASEQNPFAEFTKILETQRQELDKIMKPFLESQQKAQEMSKPVMEYQQKLIEESLEIQKAIMENILQTSRKMIGMMSDAQKMRSAASASMGAGEQFTEYFRTMQKIQESWMDQLKSTSEMFQDMMQKNR
jgi:hypothetical protein